MSSNTFKKSLDKYISKRHGTHVTLNFRLKMLCREVITRMQWLWIKVKRFFRLRFAHLRNDLDLSKVGNGIFVIKKKKTVRQEVRVNPDDVEKIIRESSIK